jgi:acyl carrier protein
MLSHEERPALIRFLEQLLGSRMSLEAIDHEADLFELGLDSIDAVEVTGDIEAHYDIEIDPALLFEERSIAKLTNALIAS